ncbi:MAG: arylamine N-acetyltransferase, partial [Chloroflexota bacterium]
IKRRRGGFCYELNGLFSSLLRQLGFQVERLSANVGRDDGTFSADFDHMTLLVTLNERWLVDVGFGETFLQPLRLDSTDVNVQDNGEYQLKPEGDGFIMYENRPGKDWAPGLRFTTQPYEYANFVDRCHFQQYSPDSTFKKGRICSLATLTGRISLSELKFITTVFGGGRVARELADEAEFSAVLKAYFGIIL